MNENKTILPNKKILISILVGFIIIFDIVAFSTSFKVRGQDTTSPWIIIPQSDQWIKNSEFENSAGWNSLISGDQNDLSTNIQNGTANYNITGYKGNNTWIETPDAGSWIRIKNEDNMTLPDNFDANSFGWYADHTWDNQVNQSIKVQWQKNFTIQEDMSDYNITNASLEAWINATVQAESLDNGGIDIPGDTKQVGSNDIYYALGDYAAFFVYISNLDKSREFETIYYRTTNLGKDGDVDPPITDLNDTKIEPQNEDTLRFYLDEVLKKDNHNFSLTIGIYLWCEDNGYPTDADYWDALWIKNLSLSISYEKVINKYSSASWEYQGNQIDSKGGILNILDAKLFFDANISDSLIGNISRNSEIRVYLNDKLYKEKVRLSELDQTLESIKENGFDLTEFVSLSKNKPLKIKIEVYIADEFDLDKIYMISIDNVKLNINYSLLYFNPTISEQESILPIIMVILALAVIGGLSGYYIYYSRVLRFPKPIRKLKKYRKSLKKSKIPNIEVKNREKSFLSKMKGEEKLTTSESIKNLAQKAKKKIIESRKSINNNKKVLIVVFMLFFFMFGFLLSPILVTASSETIPKLTISQNQIVSSQSGDTQLVAGAFREEWVKNSGFETADNWFPIIDADDYDIDYNIKNEMANYIINGLEETFQVHSGTPTNISSPYWFNSTNYRVSAYPTLGFGLNESGFYASHLWDEHSGSIYNADQRVSVQWEKLITMPRDMADFNITSATLEVTVNATVKEEKGWGDDVTGGYGGIDVYGDDEGHGWSITEGDFVKFYVMLANADKTLNFTVATYLNKSLGRNEGLGYDHTDFLYDTIFSPKNMYDLIFYINQVLEGNYRNFTLILGMEFNCEDNFTTDIDEFVNVLIKACDFNITYRRVINRFSKVSWEYKGKKLYYGAGIIVDITQALLNFDYKTNKTIPFNLTSNSEFRFLINGIENTETIKLYDATTDFQRASSGGFDVTDLIPYNENINLTIQVVLADEFGLNETIAISIDDVSLVIGYNLYTIIPVTRTTISPIFLATFIGLAAIAVAFVSYFIYYFKVLRFPEPIRKLRKYRKSLKKEKIPRDISVISREHAFREKI